MSGAGLKNLRRERGRYDLSRRSDFGSLRSRVLRDKRMALQLGLAPSTSHTNCDFFEVLDLARKLGRVACDAPAPPSRASQVTQGYVRLHVGGALYRLVEGAQHRGQKVTFATMAFRGGDVRPDELLHVDPRRWASQLKADLDRVRKKLRLTGPGWSVFFLDCDYLQKEGLFLFHWHGFATGSELAAVDALRKLRKYKSPRQQADEERDLVNRRVVLKRKRLRNIGYLCLYVLKERWPSQPSARNQPGNRDRSYPRPMPAELVPLERLFFDRWTIEDISVLRGLRVIKGRLTPTT
ncbi:hypothetical protein F1C10_11615 [Sphingomonas sp. NBWT7]|uniref:hypothetical protein n=1 Tax=Sphingomonas sp. NBWT7 TaxID=2596913 RepID=UPI00162668E3|nr:hypothetical protein [Sphingomonas sp. NBWT7]QNE32530.1 hypothetical protein F1C10_11615 [Sphingomonas sp. NBWT7]